MCTCRSRTIAQAVSRLLPIATALVRAQVRSCGGQGDTEEDFIPVLRFPRQFSHHQLLHIR
jgi:hypothetical protein